MGNKTGEEKKVILFGALGIGLLLFKNKLFGMTVTDVENRIKEVNDKIDKLIEEAKNALDKEQAKFQNKVAQSEETIAKKIQEYEKTLELQRQQISDLVKKQEELARQRAEQRSKEVEANYLEVMAQLKEAKLKEGELLAKINKEKLEEAENKVLQEALANKIAGIKEAIAREEKNLAEIEKQKNLDASAILQKQAEAKRRLSELLQQQSKLKGEVELFEVAVKLSEDYAKMANEARTKLAEQASEARKALAKQLEEDIAKQAELASKARLQLAEQQRQLAEDLYKKSLQYASDLATEASKAREEQAKILREFAMELAEKEHEYSTKLAEQAEQARLKQAELNRQARENLAKAMQDYTKELYNKHQEIIEALQNKMKIYDEQIVNYRADVERITEEYRKIRELELAEIKRIRTTVLLRGDLSGDGKIDVTDLQILQKINKGEPFERKGLTYKPPYPSWIINLADMDLDGIVSDSDINRLKEIISGTRKQITETIQFTPLQTGYLNYLSLAQRHKLDVLNAYIDGMYRVVIVFGFDDDIFKYKEEGGEFIAEIKYPEGLYYKIDRQGLWGVTYDHICPFCTDKYYAQQYREEEYMPPANVAPELYNNIKLLNEMGYKILIGKTVGRLPPYDYHGRFFTITYLSPLSKEAIIDGFYLTKYGRSYKENGTYVNFNYYSLGYHKLKDIEQKYKVKVTIRRSESKTRLYRVKSFNSQYVRLYGASGKLTEVYKYIPEKELYISGIEANIDGFITEGSLPCLTQVVA